jgi:hypothetical protein
MDTPRSGQLRDDGSEDAIHDDPHLGCNALATILNTAATTVWRRKTQSMGLTCVATRWILHNLNPVTSCIVAGDDSSGERLPQDGLKDDSHAR